MSRKGDVYWQGISEQMMAAIGGNEASVGKDDAFWGVVEAVAAVIDGIREIPVVGPIAGVYSATYSAVKDARAQFVPNPWFIWNGHDEPNYDYTAKYLRNRTLKNLGGSVFGGATAVASLATQVDVGGIMSHGQAVASSGAHMLKFKAISGSYKQSETITGWIDLLMKMKAWKTGIRGTQLAGAAIPIGAVGAVTGAIAAGAKLGVKLTQNKACLAVSSQLHWRAFQEQAISIGGRNIGPASRILYELFQRRTLTGRMLGQYSVDKIIKEPAGWMAVNDKMMLI